MTTQEAGDELALAAAVLRDAAVLVMERATALGWDLDATTEVVLRRYLDFKIITDQALENYWKTRRGQRGMYEVVSVGRAARERIEGRYSTLPEARQIAGELQHGTGEFAVMIRHPDHEGWISW